MTPRRYSWPTARADPVLPMALGAKSRDFLRAHGYTVEWHEYPMAHAVCAGGNRRYSFTSCLQRVMGLISATSWRVKGKQCSPPPQEIGCRKRRDWRAAPTRPSRQVRAAKGGQGAQASPKAIQGREKVCETGAKKARSGSGGDPPAKQAEPPPAGARQNTCGEGAGGESSQDGSQEGPPEGFQESAGFPQTAPRAQSPCPRGDGSSALGLRCRKIGHREAAKCAPNAAAGAGDSCGS